MYQSGAGGSSVTLPISPTNGGTGQNSSASTGIAQASAGTWSFSDTLARATTFQAQAIFTGSNASPGAMTNSIYNQNSTNNLIYNTGVAHVFNYQNSTVGSFNHTGLSFPSVHASPLSGAAVGICRDGSGLSVYPGDTNSRGIFGNAFMGQFLTQGNATARSGATEIRPQGISLDKGATRTVETSVAAKSGFVWVKDLTNGRTARYDVKNGTVTKEVGDAQFVAGAPAGGQVGVENSAGTLRINNNSGGALLIAHSSDIS